MAAGPFSRHSTTTFWFLFAVTFFAGSCFAALCDFGHGFYQAQWEGTFVPQTPKAAAYCGSNCSEDLRHRGNLTELIRGAAQYSRAGISSFQQLAPTAGLQAVARDDVVAVPSLQKDEQAVGQFLWGVSPSLGRLCHGLHGAAVAASVEAGSSSWQPWEPSLRGGDGSRRADPEGMAEQPRRWPQNRQCVCPLRPSHRVYRSLRWLQLPSRPPPLRTMGRSPLRATGSCWRPSSNTHGRSRRCPRIFSKC